jgi:hypothetical protein
MVPKQASQSVAAAHPSNAAADAKITAHWFLEVVFIAHSRFASEFSDSKVRAKTYRCGSPICNCLITRSA